MTWSVIPRAQFLLIAYSLCLNLDFKVENEKLKKSCMGSKFYTMIDLEGDTKGIVSMHCGLSFAQCLNIKVPSACVTGHKCFVWSF